MFAVGKDGEAYGCDSFKNFHQKELNTATALYVSAPVPNIHNMYMRFYPTSIRQVNKEDKKPIGFVPNVIPPKTTYTLALSSDNDIPQDFRKVFQIMTFDPEYSNLPSNLPFTIADLLYVENLPDMIQDIQRFSFIHHLPYNLELIDASFDKPSGCKLINPYRNMSNDFKRPTEKIGYGYRFVPVMVDATSLPGFGYIVQEDYYQFIEQLDGNWRITLNIHMKNSDGEVSESENDPKYDYIEFCGWNSNEGFFDLCYYVSIISNILNRLQNDRVYSASAEFYRILPGFVSYGSRLPQYDYSIKSFPSSPFSTEVDLCYDIFILLKAKRLIK